jgi:FkbM family methyltransferase
MPGIHRVARVALQIPGARRTFKWVTSRWGEGRVYTIRSGPMRGLRWRRENRFPYWYHAGRYEPNISRLIAAHLSPGGTFWDIGAHAGYHTLQGARAVGPSGRVLAVEPDPSVCRSLCEQVALNGFTNVTVIEVAVADSVGGARLVVREPDDTRASALESVHNPAIRNSEGVRIPIATTTLDTLAERYPSADLLKMDIEGSETTALPAGGRVWEGTRRPRRILLSYHGHDAGAFCQTFLLEHRFGLELHDPGSRTLMAVDQERSESSA